MPKIKLQEKEQYYYTYHTKLKVRDINYGGHLGNDALVSILQEARMCMLNELNCTELDLGNGETGIILADLLINYKSQGYLDDELTIHMEIDEISRSSFRLFYKVMKDKEILALAENGIVTFNYLKNKIVPIPDVFLEKIKNKFPPDTD